MTVKMEIAFNSDNDAFAQDPNGETARILFAIANDVALSGRYCEGNCVDINGNTVGSFYFEVKDD